MTSLRHLTYFVALGLFWGLSPSLYKAMAESHVPISHVIAYSGLGVGLALSIVALVSTKRLDLGRQVMFYGLGCAVLMNVPFGLGLVYARHVPTTELALIMSTAPFFNYLVALLTGRENASSRRLMAVGAGFLSSAILVLSREGTLAGQFSWWMLAAFSSPMLYTLYNWFAARHWPRGTDIYSVGASESIWSALLMVPILLFIEPPWGIEVPAFLAYWSVLAATIMWIVERIAFFTLIRDKGAVYTIQAVYLSTPAAVVFAAMFYGGGYDQWLWLSLAILMVALWLNNSGSSAKPQIA
ncbi:DMT family transporter [Aestuariivirga sp.]|uniref:DMT family transporter n=1 Tax=Aestuariivirga sp. TaxID=2650926 RepID=UPI003593DCA0